MTEPVVKPYGDKPGSKAHQVEAMFDAIAPRYDFLNRLLSLGIDVGWRRKVVRILKTARPRRVLDVATGTADLALMERHLKPERIVGVDLSEGMLALGRKKIEARGLKELIQLQKADAEHLPFEEGAFDAVSVAFGVRNFEHLDAGLWEMNRVLRPGGMLVVLEFSRPRKFPMKQLYSFYFTKLLPTVGNRVSGDAAAYSYLPESVQAFPDGEVMLEHMRKCGFQHCKEKRLTGGIATIYTGMKANKP